MEDHDYVIRLQGLPWTATTDDVIRYLRGCGIQNGRDGVHFTCMPDGRASGEAFVELVSSEDIKKSLLKNKHYMGKRYIDVFKVKRSAMEYALRQSVATQSTPVMDRVEQLRGPLYGCVKEKTANFFTDEKTTEANYDLLSKKKLCGNQIFVDYVGQKRKNKIYLKSKPFSKEEIDPLRLYIRGFDKNSTEGDLKKLFPMAERISVPLRIKDNTATGYAFADFKAEEACRAAHDSMQGKLINGNTLYILFAKKCSQQQVVPTILQPAKPKAGATVAEKSGISSRCSSLAGSSLQRDNGNKVCLQMREVDPAPVLSDVKGVDVESSLLEGQDVFQTVNKLEMEVFGRTVSKQNEIYSSAMGSRKEELETLIRNTSVRKRILVGDSAIYETLQNLQKDMLDTGTVNIVLPTDNCRSTSKNFGESLSVENQMINCGSGVTEAKNKPNDSLKAADDQEIGGEMNPDASLVITLKFNAKEDSKVTSDMRRSERSLTTVVYTSVSMSHSQLDVSSVLEKAPTEETSGCGNSLEVCGMTDYGKSQERKSHHTKCMSSKLLLGLDKPKRMTATGQSKKTGPKVEKEVLPKVQHEILRICGDLKMSTPSGAKNLPRKRTTRSLTTSVDTSVSMCHSQLDVSCVLEKAQAEETSGCGNSLEVCGIADYGISRERRSHRNKCISAKVPVGLDKPKRNKVRGQSKKTGPKVQKKVLPKVQHEILSASLEDLKIQARTQNKEKQCRCEFCNKTFADSRNLKIHVRTHAGETSYKCNICHKAFALKSGENLKRHLRTHLGEKPFKYELCEKAFKRSGSLRCHIKTHTDKKMYKSQGVVSSMMGKCRGDTLLKRIRIVSEDDECIDGKKLSATETMQDLSYLQSSDEKKVFEDPFTTGADTSPFFLRPYGCGMCDEMFEIENEFLEHCYHHYYDNPQKDTFLELFEMNLLKYFP